MWSNDISVRRAHAGDEDAILSLLSQVLEVHADIRPDLFISGTRKYTRDELLEIFTDDTRPIFVAESDDGIQGYCFCVIEETKGSNNQPDMRTLYIDDLCVDENHRGKHVGRTLYEHVVEYAGSIGCYNITLNVWEGNDSARAFYERMGFFVRKTMLERIIDG